MDEEPLDLSVKSPHTPATQLPTTVQQHWVDENNNTVDTEHDDEALDLRTSNNSDNTESYNHGDDRSWTFNQVSPKLSNSGNGSIKNEPTTPTWTIPVGFHSRSPPKITREIFPRELSHPPYKPISPMLNTFNTRIPGISISSCPKEYKLYSTSSNALVHNGNLYKYNMVPAHRKIYREQPKPEVPLVPKATAVASQAANEVNKGSVMRFGVNIPVLSPTQQMFNSKIPALSPMQQTFNGRIPVLSPTEHMYSTQPNCSVNYPVLSAMQSSANQNPVFRWMPPLPYPPHYSNPYNKKNLNFIATKILHDWYAANMHYPYPSNEEVNQLAQQGGVTEAQVRKWLANRRLRTGNTYRYNNIKRCKRQQRYIENELIKAQQFCNPSMGMYNSEIQHNGCSVPNAIDNQGAINTGNLSNRSAD